jgi:hypothetical protein
MREDRSYDPRSRVLDLDWRLVRAQAPHLEPLATTRFRLRQHYPADVERLLARAGLRIASRHGDFDRSSFRAYPVWARGESGAVCFLEGDEAAAELEEGEGGSLLSSTSGSGGHGCG